MIKRGRFFSSFYRSDSSASEPEEEDLLDWDMDFNKRRITKRRNERNTATTKRSEPPTHYGQFEKSKMHSSASSDWLSKTVAKKDPAEEKKSHHSNQISRVEDKAPLRTNRALMNSAEFTKPTIDVEPGFSKPSTFVVPQPPSCRESSGGDGQTLAQREKEERLRRQRQKQAEFLQKLQQKQKGLGASMKVSQSSSVNVTGGTFTPGQSKTVPCPDGKTDFSKSISAPGNPNLGGETDFPKSQGFDVNEPKQNDSNFSSDSSSKSSNNSMSMSSRDPVSVSSRDSMSKSSSNALSKVKPFQGVKPFQSDQTVQGHTNRPPGVHQDTRGNAPGSNRTIINTSMMNNTIGNATMSTTATNAVLANRTMSSPKVSVHTMKMFSFSICDSLLY